MDQSSLLWSDSSAHWDNSKGQATPCFRQARGLCWSSWFREASGPRRGLRGSGARTTAAASSATMDQAPCSTAATSARPCSQRERETCTSHRRCSRLHALWDHNTGSSLHMAFFLTLAPFCQPVSLNVSARFCGTTSSQTGFLEGHIFTDGSSSGSGARQRRSAHSQAQKFRWPRISILPSRLLECTRQVSPPALPPDQVGLFLSNESDIPAAVGKAESGKGRMSFDIPSARGRCALKRRRGALKLATPLSTLA